MSVKTCPTSETRGASSIFLKKYDLYFYIIKKYSTKKIYNICYFIYGDIMVILDKYDKYLKNKYKNILKEITIIGITGSSGKTSTSLLTYQLLNKCNIKASYIGEYIKNYKTNKKILSKTPYDIYNYIIESYNNNIKTIIIELNIEDIIKKIYDNIPFDIIVCTNLLTDYKNNYGTMNNYIKYKKQILKSLKFKGKTIVNIDDPYNYNFIKRNSITVGFDNAIFKIDKYLLKHNQTEFNFINKDKKYYVKTNLIGKNNIYNLSLSLAVLSYFIDISNVIDNLYDLYIPKTYEILNYGNGKILIDKAIKIGEIVTVLNTAKLFNKSIYMVLICNDNIKILSNYIVRNSKRCIITSNNINNILNDNELDNYELIINKKDAIIKGLSYIRDNGILLILGKIDDDIYDIIKESKKIKLDLVNNM